MVARYDRLKVCKVLFPSQVAENAKSWTLLEKLKINSLEIDIQTKGFPVSLNLHLIPKTVKHLKFNIDYDYRPFIDNKGPPVVVETLETNMP